MDTGRFVIYIVTEDFYKDIAGDIKRWFDTSKYDQNKTCKRPPPVGKNKKVIGLFKDALGGKIITEFSGIRPKTYVYFRDNYDHVDDKDDYVRKNKKAKGTKNCVIKRRLIFENYKDCLFNDKIIINHVSVDILSRCIYNCSDLKLDLYCYIYERL